MARRRSKEKQPSRDDYRLKEKLKIEEGIFEPRTMLRLGKLFNAGIISSMEFIIARGKEADVYAAMAGNKIDSNVVALKIFRIETSNYRRRIAYIHGDPRFGKVRETVFGIVGEWCKKEYANLQLANSGGVHAPKPYAFNGNVLAMEFVGIGGRPSARLRETELGNPESTLHTIIGNVRKLLGAGLVHADLSEYNVLMKGDVPYMIDFGQAVSVEHPNATDLLHRDVANITAFFNKRYALGVDAEMVFEEVRKLSEFTA